MQFIRVYIESDGNVKRGAITTKDGVVPSKESEVWFNNDIGMVLHKQHGKTSCYSYAKIPGNESFLIYFFKNHFEEKSFEEIIGLDKKEPVKRKKSLTLN